MSMILHQICITLLLGLAGVQVLVEWLGRGMHHRRPRRRHLDRHLPHQLGLNLHRHQDRKHSWLPLPPPVLPPPTTKQANIITHRLTLFIFTILIYLKKFLII
jgi:hypothetical protein